MLESEGQAPEQEGCLLTADPSDQTHIGRCSQTGPDTSRTTELGELILDEFGIVTLGERIVDKFGIITLGEQVLDKFGIITLGQYPAAGRYQVELRCIGDRCQAPLVLSVHLAAELHKLSPEVKLPISCKTLLLHGKMLKHGCSDLSQPHGRRFVPTQLQHDAARKADAGQVDAISRGLPQVSC